MTDEEARKQFFDGQQRLVREPHQLRSTSTITRPGICVSNPGVATLLGKDMRGVKDANGLPFAAMLMDLARQGQGSLRYTFLRSGTDPTPLDKVAFTRGFAPWHLMIGTARIHLRGRCVVLVDGPDRFDRHRRADAAVDRDRLG